MSAPGPRAARLVGIDLVRGVAMVVMALDHVRDFFSHVRFDPTDLALTSPSIFMTRWVTHFCAPLFVLLAGTSAWLHGRRVPRAELARFLLVRGLWLVVLELTVVRFGWTFNVDYAFSFAQVIWAIGWSMVALAGLVWLPVPVVAAFAIVMIAGHNLLDGLGGDRFGLWAVFHNGGMVQPLAGHALFVVYPLGPWIGVMALGWVLGAWVEQRSRLVALGLAMTAAFVALRLWNGYGDPHPWHPDPRPAFSALSFLNTTKYPPSLLFLLMTLGPGLVFLGFAERVPAALARPLVVFGRVPLFYYVLHLPLIHALAVAVTWWSGRPLAPLFASVSIFAAPPDYGYRLAVVYAAWVVVVLTLFPACRWFADVKRRRRDPWLSYL